MFVQLWICCLIEHVCAFVYVCRASAPLPGRALVWRAVPWFAEHVCARSLAGWFGVWECT